MIEKYEIKKINNEEILFIYLDIKNEFFNIKNNNVIKQIKKYLKTKKILFKGTSIALIASGILIGKIQISNSPQNNNSPIPINILESFSFPEKVNNITKLDNLDNNKNIESKSIINNKSKSNNNIANKEENTTIESELINPLEKTINKSDNQIDNNIYINLKRSNGAIETIELEQYVIGVVSAEMPAEFQENALKAQAVLARTYALKKKKYNEEITDNNSTQNYKDEESLRKIWGTNYDRYYNKIKNAVLSTKGQTLLYNNDYIEAVYHSTSNGFTESSKNVWGNYYPYLTTVESPYDFLNPSFEKEIFISFSDISKKLNTEIDYNTEFEIVEKSKSNRILTIKINNQIYKGTELRNILGLRSTDFEIIKKEDGLTFKTKGYGHGVGMSQYGANGMAKNNYSYIQILNHYYPNTTINYQELH